MNVSNIVIIIFVILLAYFVWQGMTNTNILTEGFNTNILTEGFNTNILTEGFSTNNEAAQNVYSLVTSDDVKINKLNVSASSNLNGLVTVKGNLNTTSNIVVTGSSENKDSNLSPVENSYLKALRTLKKNWDDLKPKLIKPKDKFFVLYDRGTASRWQTDDEKKGGMMLGWNNGLPVSTKRIKGVNTLEQLKVYPNDYPLNTIQIV